MNNLSREAILKIKQRIKEKVEEIEVEDVERKSDIIIFAIKGIVARKITR